MTIKTIDELTADFADNENRDITEEMLRDLVDSLKGVGGVMYAANVDPLPITVDWQPVTVLTGVRSTRGITENLSGGLFTIGPGADGPYALDISFGLESQIAGWIEIGLSKNGQVPFSKMRRSLTAGGWGVFGIPDGIDLAEGDTIGIGIRGSGNAPTQVKLFDGTFRAIRA